MRNLLFEARARQVEGGLVEATLCLLELEGLRCDFLREQSRLLKRTVGRAEISPTELHALHEHAVDGLELLVFVAQRLEFGAQIRRVVDRDAVHATKLYLRVGHGQQFGAPSAMPVKE